MVHGVRGAFYNILGWNEMLFIKKYQYYCKSKDSSNDLFKMQLHKDESLEDYVECFLYVLQKSKYTNLQEDAIRIVFLWGILDEYVETLNLMVAGDISHKPFAEILYLSKKYSISGVKDGNIIRDPFSRTSKTISTSGVTTMELGKLLEKFKTDILGTINSQLDTLKVKRKQEEENVVMIIFCPKRRK